MEEVKLVQLNQEKLLESIAEIINQKIKESLSNFESREDNTDQFGFLTRKETAKMLHVSYNTIHDWVKMGILKQYKISNRTYFKREEIIETLNSSQKKTA